MPPKKMTPWSGIVFKLDSNVPQLPVLQLPYNVNDATTVEVEGKPERSGSNLTWVVDKRPAVQIGRGHLVSLSAGHNRTGVGRLTGITDVYRHWITWSITGGPGICYIRVPIPWARLSRLEGLAHTERYHALSALPPPHPIFWNNPIVLHSKDSPYEFEENDNTYQPKSEEADPDREGSQA
ncbi:hypothetical protein EVJ58_g5575 [Rhodofomes roseus]|uniref:Uncharacterized protein n=1 Tax=Rhodofomes roseus TaxID=34475 RepID=A0A4Y9YDW5_9APHY|nr:hypothetical protein EVJ58_g5575 [Rhodofomes roseus]